MKLVSNFSLGVEQLWPPVWREASLAEKLAKTALHVAELAHTEMLGDDKVGPGEVGPGAGEGGKGPKLV